MNQYPNPCDACRKTNCNYRTCPDYIKRINTIWKQARGYLARVYRSQRETVSEKFIYEHPDIIRWYLQEGPCKACRLSANCDTPCVAYWHWWDARMEWMRVLLREEK